MQSIHIEHPELVPEKEYSEALRYLRAKRIPFPLRSLLKIYISSERRNLYRNYYEGFRLLHEWLQPISTDGIIELPIPNCIGSYDLYEIARILGIRHEKVYGCVLEIHYGRQFVRQLAEHSVK